MISGDGLRMMGVVYIKDKSALTGNKWKRRYMDADIETQRLRLFANDQSFEPKLTLKVPEILSVERTQQLKVDKDKGFHFTVWYSGENSMKLKTLNKEERDSWFSFLQNMMSDNAQEKKTNTSLGSLLAYLSSLSTRGIQFTVDTHSFFELPSSDLADAAFGELRKGHWIESLKDTVLSTDPYASEQYLPVRVVELRCGEGDEVNNTYIEPKSDRLIFFVHVGSTLEGKTEITFANAHTVRGILSNHPWKSQMQKMFQESHREILSSISGLLGNVPVNLEFGPDVRQSPEIESYVENVITAEFLQKVLTAVNKARQEVQSALNDNSALLQGSNSALSSIRQITLRISHDHVVTSTAPSVFLRRAAVTDSKYSKRFNNALMITRPELNSPLVSNTSSVLIADLNGPTSPRGTSFRLDKFDRDGGNDDSLSNSIAELWYRLSVVQRLLNFEESMRDAFGLENPIAVRWNVLSDTLNMIESDRPARISTALAICKMYEERLRTVASVFPLGTYVKNITITFHHAKQLNPSTFHSSISITRSGKLQETIYISKAADNMTFPPFVLSTPVPPTTSIIHFAARDLTTWMAGFGTRHVGQDHNQMNSEWDGADEEAEDSDPSDNEGTHVPEQLVPIRPILSSGNELISSLDERALSNLQIDIAKGFKQRITPKDIAAVTKEGLVKLQKVFCMMGDMGAKGFLNTTSLQDVVRRIPEFEHTDIVKIEQQAMYKVKELAGDNSPVFTYEQAALGILPLIVPKDVTQSVASRREILLVGLESVGKTSLINILKGRTGRTYSTVGYCAEIVFFESLNLRFTEIGGSAEQREKWQYVFKTIEQVDAVMFVVDTSSPAVTEARRYLKEILSNNKLKNVPLIFVVNSPDKQVNSQESVLPTTVASLKVAKYCGVFKRPYITQQVHITPGVIPSPLAKEEILNVMRNMKRFVTKSTDVPRRVWV